MPIYEYDCRACGNAFELLVMGSETPTCPSCASSDLERRVSMPSFSSEGQRQRSIAAVKERNRSVRNEQAAADDHAMRHQHDDH